MTSSLLTELCINFGKNIFTKEAVEFGSFFAYATINQIRKEHFHDFLHYELHSE